MRRDNRKEVSEADCVARVEQRSKDQTDVERWSSPATRAEMLLQIKSGESENIEKGKQKKSHVRDGCIPEKDDVRFDRNPRNVGLH